MFPQKSEIFSSEDIVITGISGAFPGCDNVAEYRDNLLEGKDLTSNFDRYNRRIRTGLLRTIDRFDHSFFHLTHQQAEFMLIGSKILLEKTFEAVLDAGYNPQQIKGKDIAVICGVWDTCHEGDPAMNVEDSSDYTQALGRSEFMLANRISFCLDLHGPSVTLNAACSSSMYALDYAFHAIKSGRCEAALVVSPNLCLSEADTHHVDNALVSTSAKSAPFDAEAKGFVKAETTAAIFLQKRKDARRVYATVLHVKTKCEGFKEEGPSFPSVKLQMELYKQFYEEADIDPRCISYFEAHGTGTRVGDIVECTSIEEFFTPGRNTPIKIGSVKSNVGHAEAAAALCSLVKLLLSFETGLILPTINYNTPNPNIKGLHNGRLQVVTKSTPLDGEYYAINSFGAGGSIGHTVLTPNSKFKKLEANKNDEMPRLVTVSGRTEEAVDCILNDLEKNPNDTEYIRLMHEIFSDHINGHLYRGYTILNHEKELFRSKKFFSGEKRPIWFVYGGMGSQWSTMGKSLMKIPKFAESVCKSHEILRTKGINLIEIITNDDPQIFENVLNCFVGIAAIQIALTDILTSLDIQPNGIIGHSLGELGCAYSDGCFTAEQMLLAAYYRGLTSITQNFIPGKMAAVGESYATMKDIIPPEIDIACHNSSTSCTISGPAKEVENFINTLKEKNIFVREVNCANIAYHSRYIQSAGPEVEFELTKIIPEPKLRSKKWISTSTPEHEWNSDKARYSSSWYHTNNILGPVYFEEGCQHIPSNAITVEIGPHSLLNPILKRSLPSTVENIPLTMRNHENGVEFLLNSLGRIYEVGGVPRLSNLYPAVEFPVGRSTPMISPLIKWQHDEEWPLGRLNVNMTATGERNFMVNPTSDEYAYVTDHIIDGINIYPGIGYLALVWETVAVMKKRKMFEMSIVFENIRFKKLTIVPKKGLLKFRVTVQIDTNSFEVTENEAVVASGIARVPLNIDKEFVKESSFYKEKINSEILPLSAKDFYKEMRLKGYHFKDKFKNVTFANPEGTQGRIRWNNNFMTFIDATVQISTLRLDCRDVMLPTFIRKIVIDVNRHREILKTLNSENPEFPVTLYPNFDFICSGGVQVQCWKLSEIARRKDAADPVLEKYQFVPYISDEEMDLSLAVRICIHIVLENMPTTKVKTCELLDGEYNPEIPTVSNVIADALKDLPLIEANINILPDTESYIEAQQSNQITILKDELPRDKSSLLIILSSIQDRIKMIPQIFEAIKDNGFIIAIEPLVSNMSFESLGLNVIFSRSLEDGKKILLLKKITENSSKATIIKISSESYSWISNLKNVLMNINAEEDEQLIVYAEKEPMSGILGFFNCLRREKNGNMSRCYFIMDDNAPKFSLKDPFHKAQFHKNLSHNVYKNGEWGSYRHLPFGPATDIETVHAFCALEERGNLSSFRWMEGSLNPYICKTQNGKTLAQVYYSSLNFRDVMLAVRKFSPTDLSYYSRLTQNYEGSEFSGRNENGERIMGILYSKGIATVVETVHGLSWKVPDYMTLEEAATIPIVYATVIYAFFFVMELRKGSTVLIHAGSGGIGQAAINICLHYQCNIFTTVGTAEKVEFIRKTYPQIPASNIGNSRDTIFENIIMKETNGRGVDVVLNSLSEDKLRASVRCVAEGGNFLEIGKFDLIQNNPLELGSFLKNISFHGVQLDLMIWGNPEDKNENMFNLQRQMQQMLDEKIIKPIRRTVFEKNEVESALRYMGAGKHIGKVLIKIRDEENYSEMKPPLLRLKAKPQVLFQENESCVIVGGLGGVGMELSDWLILRGFRNLVLCSRTGITNGYQSYRIKLWRSYGVKVVISTQDVTEEMGIKNILKTASSLGPVTAIFNLAVVLEDNPILDQTEDSFRTAIGPKAIATIHLDKLSRKMCPNLNHFVVFSSVACGRGNNHQTNYGFANSVMERICEARHSDNLPALAIQWGAIGEVGIVANFAEDNKTFVIGGTLQQKLKSCFDSLNLFMKQSHPIVASMVVAEKRHLGTDIINVVAHILSISDLKLVSPTWTLPELGMDSILSTELKQILETEFNMFFTPEDLRNMTFAKLHQLKEGKQETKSGAKIMTQIQFFMDENLLNKSILRVPLESNLKHIPHSSYNKKPTVFFFPGIEGIALGIEPLAKNLNVHGLCFQYHYNNTEQSCFQEMCKYYSKSILETLAPDEEFHIVAHCLGGLFAIEVVSILENAGKKGRVYMIESSPSLVNKMMTDHFGKISVSIEPLFQNNLCVVLMQMLLPKMEKPELIKHLEKVDNWEDKKATCFSLLPPQSVSKNSMHRMFDRIYNMYKLVPTYKISAVAIKAPGILIRCDESSFDLDESYGLSEYFENPLQVHQIHADHYSILLDPKTAHIIMESIE